MRMRVRMRLKEMNEDEGWWGKQDGGESGAGQAGSGGPIGRGMLQGGTLALRHTCIRIEVRRGAHV